MTSGRETIFFTAEGNPSHSESLCGNCGRIGALTFESMMSSYAPPTDSLEPQIMDGLLIFDCANAIALLSRCNPDPPEKCYRLICAYLHDAQQFTNMSFANAGCNLADTGAKLGPNAVVWRSFLQNGLFFIVYLRRKEFKTSRDNVSGPMGVRVDSRYLFVDFLHAISFL